MVLLTFQIDYHTTWGGQSVCLCGSIPELGNYNETDAVVLSNDGDRWYTEINVSETAELQYYYFIRQGNSTIRREWGSNRRLNVIEKIKEYLVQDLWKNRPYHTYLYSSAFTESIFFS